MLSRAGLYNKLFVVSETLRALSATDSRRKILFSRKPDWESAIASGFRSTRHEVTFAELSRENVLKHDLVVPLTLEALMSLDGMRALLEDNPIAIPSLQSVALCNDKDLFNRALIDVGYGKLIPSIDGNLGYPYILKKKVDEWSANSFIVRDRRDEETFAAKIADPDYFRQTFVPGRSEYAAHLVFQGGRVMCSLNVRYLFACDTPIKGRDKLVSSEVCGCPYLDQFAAILKFIGFEGLCCFNYKAVDGAPYVLELNPRFGGSLAPFFFAFIRHLSRRKLSKAINAGASSPHTQPQLGSVYVEPPEITKQRIG